MKKNIVSSFYKSRARCSLISSILLIFIFTAFPVITQAQNLEMVSSEPSHLSSAVELETTVQLSFNVPIHTFGVDPIDMAGDYILVSPWNKITIHSASLSEDQKVLSFKVTHQPDTDYTWIIPDLEGMGGEIQTQSRVINYTTASAVSDLTIKGKMSLVNAPVSMFQMSETETLQAGSNRQSPTLSDPFSSPMPTDPHRNAGTSRNLQFGNNISSADDILLLPDHWGNSQSGLIPQKVRSGVIEQLVQNTPEIWWGTSIVLLLDNLDWMEMDEMDGPLEAIVNAGVTVNPNTGEYLVENVRPGEYYLLALLARSGTDFQVIAITLHADEDGEPVKVTVGEENLTGIDITLYGFMPELANPVEAATAYSIAVDYMKEYPGTRPIELWGIDSAFLMRNMSHNRHELPMVASGMSFFWETIFFHDEEELIYFVVVTEDQTMLAEVFSISEIEDEIPDFDFSDLKTLPDTFLSSRQALNVARGEQLDEILSMLSPYSWVDLEYMLSGFFFLYPDIMDKDSPVFWEVFFESFHYDPYSGEYQDIEAIFLIDATNGELIEKFFYGDIPDKRDLQEVFSMVQQQMSEISSEAQFVHAWGREDFAVTRGLTGTSESWMIVWFDPQTEIIHLFFTRGGEIYEYESQHLDEIPPEERGEIGELPHVPISSREATDIAMEHGLRNVLAEFPVQSDDLNGWVHYNMMIPHEHITAFTGDYTGPIWLVHARVQVFGEDYQKPAYWLDSMHAMNAFTGEYLGSMTNVATEEETELPAQVSLFQNYPNPFNPVTTIVWEMNMKDHVQITVHDLLGREVAMLVNEDKPAGVHSVTFDASGLASGIYLYRLQTGTSVLNRKMTLVK